VCTLTAVFGLLLLGGTFTRIAEQTKDDEAVVPTSVQGREGRPLMLERLLEARERLTSNYGKGEGPRASVAEGFSALTMMMMNVAPSGQDKAAAVPDLVDEADKGPKKGGLAKILGVGGSQMARGGGGDERKKEEIRRHIPEGYEENYVTAYRTCQERPGGPPLPGLPDARPEAYARAFAGCGTRSSPAYRRSYARLYEAHACNTHASEIEFRERFEERPGDLMGRSVRLEPLEAERHVEALHRATSGDAFLEEKPYEPRLVWGFLDRGPFANPEELRASRVFRLRSDEASFAVVETSTDTAIGIVTLVKDDPRNLSVQLEPPVMNPAKLGSKEQMEGCFLLLDRLFGLGYRRVSMYLDSQDEKIKRFPEQLGFTQEGSIPKHMIIKEANRDSNVYGLINSDWDKGARATLYKKLHGPKALRADELNNKKEAEYDEWQVALEKQRNEEKESKTKKKQ